MKPLRLVTLILVDTSSSQSVLAPSQRDDSPPTVSEVDLAEIVKSGLPEGRVTTTVWDVLRVSEGVEASVTVKFTAKELAVE